MFKNTRKGLANRIFSMFLAIALVVTLCPSDMGFVRAEEEVAPVTISGTVQDSNGIGVEDVNVTVYNANDEEIGHTVSNTTGGFYKVSGCIEPAKVVFSKDGMATQIVPVNATGQPNISLGITMLAEGERTVEFTIDTASITMLETTTNTATASDNEGVITYSSSDQNVATVDANGKVTPVSAGTTTITATCEETENYDAASASYTLNVSKADQAALTWVKEIPTNLTWKDKFFNIVTGGSTDGAVTYSSSNTEVATVDGTGLVTLNKASDTPVTITATKAGNDIYNDVTASYDIMVNKADRDVSWTTAVVVLKVGTSINKIKVPYQDTMPAVTDWVVKSDNEDIVTKYDVASDGVILKAKQVGETTVDITIPGDEIYNEKVLSCQIKVVDAAEYGSFRFQNGNSNVVLEVGETCQNPAMINENLATVIYTSSDDTIATVNSDGIVTAVKSGTVTITATDELSHSITYQVTVESEKQTISFANENLQEVSLGDDYQNVATALTTVTYSSSDNTIAEPDNDGKVTLHKAGTVVITATAAAENGYEAASASYILRITAKEQVVSFAETAKTVTFGENGNKFTQVATSTADGEADNTVTYSVVSGNDKATVDPSTGEVTIIGAGTIEIKATYSGNNVYKPASATYTLTVNKASQTISFEGDGDFTAKIGDEFTAPVLDTNGAPGSGDIVYSSDDSDIADVNATTGEITIGEKEGTVTITATKEADDNYEEATASYTITVSKKSQVITFENGTEVNVTFNDNNNEYTNIATSNAGGTPTYSVVSGSDKATVDENTGKVTILHAGTIVIKATFAGTTEYAADSATYTINVAKASQTIEVDTAEIKVDIGQPIEKPTVTLSEKHGTGAITYTSSNRAVATVDINTGVVTLSDNDRTGSTTITVRKAADDDYKEATTSYTIKVAQWTPENDDYVITDGIRTYSNGVWFTDDVVVKAANGYQVSFDKQNGYTDELTLVTNDTDGTDITFYIKNSENSRAKVELTIKKDETAPTLQIKYQEKTVWEKILTFFGVTHNDKYEVVNSDATSGIASVKYFVDYLDGNETSVVKMSDDELNALEDSVWTNYTEKIEMAPNQVYTIYAKATDNAGNYIYTSTNGIVHDKAKPEVNYEVITEGTLYDDTVYGTKIYDKDIDVKVLVTDAAPHSGIKTVTWEITDFAGNSIATDTITVTDKADPNYNDLEASYDFTLDIANYAIVDNSFILKVTAEDFSGNVSDEKVERYIIDTTVPTVDVSFTDDVDAYKKEGNVGYYDGNKEVTIVVTERKELFDNDKATECITLKKLNSDGEIVEVPSLSVTWDNVEHATNSDLDTHTAVITFEEDNTYALSFEYKNLALKDAEEKAMDFVVDKVDPVLTVEAQDANKVANNLGDAGNAYDIYDGDIKVDISVEDAQISSNIETLEYTVTCYNHIDNGTVTAVKETMSETFTPQALRESGGTITISAEENQAEKIVLTVTTTDNCGNSDTETRTYAINTQAPTIEVTYDNNAFVNEEGNRGYYKEARTMEVVYTERTDLFDQAKAEAAIDIDALNIAKDAVEVEDISWVTIKGGSCYEDTHKATVTFENDANYDITISYENALGQEATLSSDSKHPYAFTIDKVAPAITLEYADAKPSSVVDGDKGYFNGTRTATIIITEDTSFDADDVVMNITAKDADNNDLGKVYEVSEFEVVRDDQNGTFTHQATVYYGTDANYTFDISYTDKVLLENTAVQTTATTPYNFAVDIVNPTGEIKIGETSFWRNLLDIIDIFGWFNSNKAEKATITCDDVTSGVKSVEYFRTTDTTLKTADELEAAGTTWNPYTEELELPADSKLMIYAKIVDKSGLTTYLSTGGIVIDTNAPVLETLKPEITITAENGNDTIYTGDVAVSVDVKEPIVTENTLEIYSGIKEIKYTVSNLGTQTISKTLEAAANGTFVEKTSTTNENTNQFIKEATVDFVVDCARNNSNSVVVEVEAIDFAGNVGKETINLKIDTTAPQISVSFDNNDGDTSFSDTTYFNKARTATIIVKEDNFDPAKVSLLSNGASALNWSSSANNANGDGGMHQASVTFASDGDYTFGISCTDKAGHGSGTTDFGGSLAPQKFTVDLTEPQITVSYDNNNAMNGNYYRNARIATIQVKEHNFETGRVNFVVTATDNGQQATLPALSNWVTNGDTHTATVVYDKDALYTFDFDYTDKAGNKAADIPTDTFYVDLTAPKVSITNIVDESANSGDGNIGFSITATDTNFDVFTPVLTAVVKEGNTFVEKTISGGGFSNIANGQVYTIRNVDLDGIYRIGCTVVDKAGNAYTEVALQDKAGATYVEERTEADTLVTFSVNRNGSAYEVDEDTMEIVEQYYVQDITKDVVLIEVNTNSLKEYKVTLNGKELKENSDYTVKTEGGRGEWMKYIYSINKSLFEAEGQYKIVVSSVDAADNNAFSDVKDATVTFVVDRTAPVISVSGLESNGRYQVERQTVTIIPTDDGGALKSLLVRTVDEDGNELVRLIDLAGDALLKALEENDGKIVFEIEEGLYQNVQIICNDCAVDTAGNTNTYNETFYEVSVSTSAVKMLFANKPVRYGIIAGVIVILGGVALLVFTKKKSKKVTK